ncbi:efflux RND transporter periplasmic adaptor subunit [Chromobacterium haemolyticum]|uniref:efflux RND transporter periplasmic adaptor subunit n=1 Tax=Chromobacterium haemolyticum TaxID=394935 RepID=UPI0005BE4C63|nr:efflux RND transporter periplasmic adaptor subunit [Chromobacterium haemolyticum]
MNKRVVASAAALALAAAGLAGWYGSRTTAAAAKTAARPPIAVGIAKVTAEDLPIELNATGNVTAIEKVEVKPQVSGVVAKVHVKEGQNVAPGQLLFTLDAAAEIAQLKKAQAQTLSDQAQLKNAERDLARSRDLLAKNFVSQSVVDANQSKADALSATVAADRAQVEAARAALDYKTLRASIGGRIGVINVYPGTLAQPGMAAAMLTITRIHPINATFTLPERELGAVRAAQAAGKLQVRATLPDSGDSVDGKLVFIDSAVDSANGTLTLKAEFSNQDGKLWPGQFVTVSLGAGRYQQATTIPVAALLTGPEGKFSYAVQADGSVKRVPVELLAIHKEKAVVKGLRVGDAVVSNGGLNLRPGDKVRAAVAGPASGGQ